MASGWQALGNAIGGGNKLPSALAYEQGQSIGANTADALAQARARVDKNNYMENMDQDPHVQAAFPDPKDRATYIAATLAGQSPESLVSAQSGQFKLGQQKAIADPTTSDAQTARNLLSIGQNANIIHNVGEAGSMTNELHPDLGVQVSPLGAAIGGSTVAKNNAEAAASSSTVPLHASQARLANTNADVLEKNGGVKPSLTYAPAVDADGNVIVDPNTGMPKLSFRQGSAADPNAPKVMSAVTQRYFQNSMNSVLQGATALDNIVNMPGSPSSGFMGSGLGGHAGETPIGIVKANLLAKVNPDDVNRYNTIMSGLQQNLATADNSGRAANQTYVNAMDRTKILGTDNQLQVFTKLADAKQILGNALQSWEDTTSLSDAQKAAVTKNLATLDRAIPFNQQDVNRLANSQNPRDSLATIIGKSGVVPQGAPRVTANNGPAAPAPPAALQFLAAHPEAANDFKAKYGYLPGSQ